MTAIPMIFKNVENPLADLEITRFNDNSRWVEFNAHLSQFSELDIPDTRGQLEALLEQEANPAKRAVLLTGIARCIIHSGDFIKGAKTLGYAYSFLSELENDAQAFILLEMAAFMAITAQYDLALMLLDRIPHLTNSIYLLNIANYYRAVHQIRKGELTIVETLEQSAVYFKQIGEFSTLAYHYKNIGNVYRKFNDFPQAEFYYEKALKLAKSNNYIHITAAVTHDIGMLHYRKGEFEKAIKTLQSAFEMAESFYTKSFTVGNMGFLYASRKDWSNASVCLQKALNIATTHGVFSIIPTIAYHLGKSYEKQRKMELAHFFYKKGHAVALELLSFHFPYTGDRKRVVERYVALLIENQKDTFQSTPDVEFDLSFAIDKTLQEIRGLFQSTLLDKIFNKFGNIQKTIDKLGLARRTYFSIKERTKKFPIVDPPDAVLQFIQQNENLKWKEINQKFDQEMLVFLYKKYDSNKKILSEKLGISYPYLVNLTRKLELNGNAIQNQTKKIAADHHQNLLNK